MGTTTDSLLESIGRYIADIMARVSEFLWANFRPVFDKIATWIDGVVLHLDTVFTRLKTFIGNMFTDISDKIRGLVEDALTFIGNIFDRVADKITGLFNEVTGYISDTFTAVYDEMLSIADTVKSTVVDLYDEVVNAIKSTVSDITIWLGTLLDDVKLAITTLLDRATSVVVAISRGVQDFISSVIDVVGASLRELMETASKIPAALTGLGEGFKEAIEEFIGQPLDNLPASMWTSLTKSFDELHGDEQDKVFASLHETYLSGNSPPKNNDELRSTFNALVPESGVLRGFFLSLFGVLSALMSIASITTANAQIMLQEYSLTSPHAILSPADAIRANHFGITNDEDTKIILRKHGHDIADADKLLEIGHQSPPEGEALSWFLRGIYTEEDLDNALSKNGWSAQDKAALKKAAQIIPPVQDLITMAVREVFTPEIAERFGQFDEYPPQFGEWAAKTGLSEEWSKNYWASHWALPSPQMGFEMLHRRVIEPGDLDLLLKSADVMPFWRQKIVDISYSPYTRVDIRRMHKSGVLDEAEVFEAYQDIGYSSDKARRLTDFTLDINRDTSADDDIGLLELSRSNILNFYADGLLDIVEAKTLLIGVGQSEEAADLYLMSVDMDEERQTRKDETALILDRAKAGLITFDQAQDKLATLNLETRELSKAKTKLIRQQAQLTKLPSKTDLDKMLSKDIIGVDEYKETMQLLGYSELWTNRYYQLIKGQ